MAMKHLNSETKQCAEAAEVITNLNLNAQTSREIYKTMKSALNKLADIRKGFFCVICDAKTHTSLHEVFNTTQFYQKVLTLVTTLQKTKNRNNCASESTSAKIW